jgi:hypothetical protein
MASGLEMMALKVLENMLPKLIENLPPELVANAFQIGQNVASFKAQLDRIENQQRLIMAHLNIPGETQTTELEHAGSGIRNGASPG